MTETSSNLSGTLVSSSAGRRSESNSSHFCGICGEMMVAPSCAPFMLVPCGHTFCERCVRSYCRESAAGQAARPCPQCREAIQASVQNRSLRAVIEACCEDAPSTEQLAPAMESAIRETAADPAKQQQIREYVSMYSLAAARASVLGDERAAAAAEVEKAAKTVSVAQQVVGYLAKEQAELEAELQRLARELEISRQQHAAKAAELRDAEQQHADAGAHLAEVDATLAAVSQEQLKAQTLLAHLAPHLQLDDQSSRAA